jgi:hypothetical protein
MAIEPSRRTGAWAALGLVPYDVWDKAHPTVDHFLRSFLFLLVIAVFFFIPYVYFVLGRSGMPLSRKWYRDAEQRARFRIIARRMFAWFVGAVVTGIAWSLLIALLWPKEILPN